MIPALLAQAFASAIPFNAVMLRISGVYLIRCTANDRLYCGRSVNIVERFGQHCRLLREGRHENKTLCADYRVHGEEKFEFSILLQTKDDAEAARIERETILTLKAAGNCYNVHVPLGGSPKLAKAVKNLPSKSKPKQGS